MSHRKKFLLIYNPVSGHAANKRRLDEIVHLAQARGAVIVPYRTERENPGLPAFIREMQPDGILAAGGDGTLNLVANILLKNSLDFPLGIIGSGTSNDFATYLGVKKDLPAYFDRIVAGNTRSVDVGRVGAGEKYFINVASAGMLTSVPHKVNVNWKNSFGKLAYYFGGLKELPRFKPLDLTVEADGQVFSEKALFFVVVNSSAVASLKNIADGIELDDGFLDLLVVRWANIAEMMKLALSLAAGKGIGSSPLVRRAKAAHFKISAEETAESDLDGERGPLLPLEITAIPRALRVYC